MRKLILLACGLLISAAQNVMGQPTVKDANPRLDLPQEKEQQLLTVATDLCAKFAPDYDISNLTPVIAEFRELNKYDRKMLPQAYADSRLAIVYFMADTTSLGYSTFKHHNDITGEDEYLRRPIATLQAYVCLDNMEPVGIMGEYGMMFKPDYETFCKKNPDYRLPKRAKEDLPATVQNVNKLAKKELEAKGYKNVRIGE